MSEQYQFVVRKGPKVGQVFRLIQDVISIGRDPLSDIVMNDPEISRHHAKLVRVANGYTIEDFGSTNGTYIDGRQLNAHTETELVPGQLVSMGSGVILLYGVLSDEVPASDTDADEVDLVHTPAMVISDSEPIDLPNFGTVGKQTAVNPDPSAPLVPSTDSPPPRRRRPYLITAIILFLLLAACLLSAYYVWGDPLMRALGFY